LAWGFVLFVFSCGGSSGDLVDRDAADAATKAGAANTAEVLGPTWGAPRAPLFVGATIAERCGNPGSGLGVPAEGLLSSATSPVLFSDPDRSPSLHAATHVRTALLAYDNNEHAGAVFDKIGAPAFNRCLAAAVNTYIRGDHPDADPVPDATADSFETKGAAVFRFDEARVVGSTFEQELIGGYDNKNNEVLFVARSGNLVATAVVAASGQNFDPADWKLGAPGLGSAALLDAVASLRD
jgi:hypothetical protein